MEIKRKSQSISSQTPEERRNIQKKNIPIPKFPAHLKRKKIKALIKDLLKSEIITMILIIKNNDRVDITFLSPSHAPPEEISKNPETPEKTPKHT